MAKNGLKKADTIASRVQNWLGAIGIIFIIIVYVVMAWMQINKNTADIDDTKDTQKEMLKDMNDVIEKRDSQIKEDKKIINDLENRIVRLETIQEEKEKQDGKTKCK